MWHSQNNQSNWYGKEREKLGGLPDIKVRSCRAGRGKFFKFLRTLDPFLRRGGGSVIWTKLFSVPLPDLEKKIRTRIKM